MVKYAVAETMPARIGALAPAWPGRRRPELAGILVPDVKRFARRVADRVVGPWRQPKLVRVLAPGVGATTFGDDGPEPRVGKHVGPGGGRRAPWIQGDDVFTAIGGETAQAVVEHEFRDRRIGCTGRNGLLRGVRFGWIAPSRRFSRGGHFGHARHWGGARLLNQGARLIAQHNSGNRLKQQPVLRRQLGRETHENPSALVRLLGLPRIRRPLNA